MFVCCGMMEICYKEIVYIGKNRKSYFDIPKLDYSGFDKPVSEEEMERLYKKFEERPKVNWREFVDDIEKHPENLGSWDISIPFPEFARRVKAGEYD